MSTLKVLKEYLVGDGGYLLNDDNNGKTVMLSGAWGSGKTHFWQNEIEEELTKKLNKKSKACVYVSLYGKDNIEAIKNEILFKAYESIKDENKLAKRAISAFGLGSRLLSVSVGGVRANTGAVGDAVESFFESKKIDEAESFLADGGLICLDDFERKSKHVDLNDLFGFIAQLAIDMNCKVVIILNSDVFEGEEANVFKTVKEKTVNKFFHFEPSIEELFDSIYKYDSRYTRLDDYKDEILSAIKETEELNARIYIQVLDNCLEWLDKDYDSKSLKILTLTTINFILNHIVLDYVNIDIETLPHNPEFKGDIEFSNRYGIFYSNLNILDKTLVNYINSISILEDVYMNDKDGPFVETRFNDIDGYLQCIKQINDENFFNSFEYKLKNDKNLQGEMLLYYHEYKEKNRKYLSQLWKYGYRLHCLDSIEQENYEKITNFVKTGILPKKTKEVESSLPPRAN